MDRYLRPILGLALVCLLVISCDEGGTPASPADSEPTAPVAATLPATAVPETTAPSATPEPTAVAKPTAVPAEAYAGWQEYTNAGYGFSLRFPADWHAEEEQREEATLRGHALFVRPSADANVGVVIHFKRSGEDVMIMRTGVGSGELVERGPVAFAGQAISRQVLVADGKDVEVLYNLARETAVGDMLFSLQLSCFAAPVDCQLTPEQEAIADLIVASLRVSQGS